MTQRQRKELTDRLFIEWSKGNATIADLARRENMPLQTLSEKFTRKLKPRQNHTNELQHQ